MSGGPPAYLLLAARLRALIDSGDYSSGRPMPTEQALTEQYGLSRQTVRRAYLELVAEGAVDRVPGRGTFASSRPASYRRGLDSFEDLLDLALDTEILITSPLARRPDSEAAARLGLDVAETFSVQYLRRHQGAPFGRTTVSLPPDVAELILADPTLQTSGARHPLTVVGLLEHRLDSRIASVDQTISAVPSDGPTALALGCVPGHPVLRIERLFVDGRDRPVELSVGHVLSEHYVYRSRLTRAHG